MRAWQLFLVRGLASRLRLVCCAALLVSTTSAQAQPTKDELAQKHFESGAAYLQQSDYDNALREFESAYELSPRPALLLNIATVHERMGQLPEAVAALNRYLELEPQGEHAETVKLRIQNLQKRIDESAQASAPPPAAVEPEPAEPAPPPTEQPAAPAPAPARASEPNRLPAYLVLGGAGLFAVGAAVTGIMANSEYSELERDCKPDCTDDEVSSGKTLALTSTILTGLAVVGAGVGVALFVTAGPADEAPAGRLGPRLAIGADEKGARASATWRF